MAYELEVTTPTSEKTQLGLAPPVGSVAGYGEEPIGGVPAYGLSSSLKYVFK